ncbi:lipoyltransferase 1, mitochondrial [Megalops cyprinoides]|uniref:lipoyltransferase 1, mitochondrial n=1 Tax=Megalops cyprinoides TaxID=118141 RepID=UPI0018645643|nr:lipoyltransferase 1, mitochondrial [Megalops cyprinoides]
MIIRTFNMCVKTYGCLRFIRPQSTLTTVFEEGGTAGLVLKSTSTNIYENLAFEDWIHQHVDLENRSILFLWRNAPAVVIGRHQNPWQECNLRQLREWGIPLARRRSGGGTVFHDLGNINMTFFTSKRKYDRHRNLSIVTSALKKLRPGLDVHATDRFDILLNGHFKISGTAAKLGRKDAYHHCTLLCAADKILLSAVLKSTCQGITSNATPSVPSQVKNLMDEDPTLDCDMIMEALASQYNLEFGLKGPVTLVDPTDELSMPGIRNMALELQTWEWVYGRTPKFSVSTCFEVSCETSSTNVTLNMDVKNGIIETCTIELPHDWLPTAICKDLSTLLVGSKFCPTETAVVTAAMLRTNRLSNEFENKMHILCESVAAVM